MESSLQGIAPVVLAAGDSSRIGFPKALLPLGKGCFLSRIMETLGSIGPAEVTVVVGRHAEVIRRHTSDPRVRFLVNPNPEAGQISSIQLALRGLGPDVAACLVWPVDQPAVSGSLVGSLIRLCRESGALVVMPACGGVAGHPAVFRRALFHEFLSWPVGESPKQLIRRYLDRTALLPTQETAVLADVDTPEDYFRLTGERLEDALRQLESRRF